MTRPPRRDLTVGSVHECPYPFVRERRVFECGEGPGPKITWNPGVRRFDDGEYEDVVHDGMGARIATVVSVHKPGRHHTRVFYTLQWRDPTGRLFGTRNLRVATVKKFLRHASGYAHESRQAEPGETP